MLTKQDSSFLTGALRRVPMRDTRTVRKYFRNLTYLGGYQWKDEFDKYISIDYDKYLENYDFNLTEEQIKLSKKFNEVKERFKMKQLEDYNNFRHKKEEMKIGNFNFENIPNKIKGFIFVLIFAFIFGGSIFLLKYLLNKPKNNKDKKKQS